MVVYEDNAGEKGNAGGHVHDAPTGSLLEKYGAGFHVRHLA